jgi:hypothetical protein
MKLRHQIRKRMPWVYDRGVEYCYKFYPKIVCRPSTYVMEEHFKFLMMKDLVGVEIGVENGNNAKNLLSRLPIKKLYLVDPFVPWEEAGKLLSFCSLEKTSKNLRKYKEELVFIKKKSEDAITSIPDNVDFVYVDGNHDYEFIKKDIELYYPKVKEHGIIAGHDYGMEAVKRAITEYAEKNKLTVNSDAGDWWFVK